MVSWLLENSIHRTLSLTISLTDRVYQELRRSSNPDANPHLHRSLDPNANPNLYSIVAPAKVGAGTA